MRPAHARPLGLDVISGLPGPGQKLIEAVDGVTVDHAFEDVAQIGEGFDVVHLGGFDQGADYGPALAAAVRTGEEMVFAAERHGPDRAFYGIVVQVDAAVGEEQAQRIPAAQGVADGFGQGAAWRMR